MELSVRFLLQAAKLIGKAFFCNGTRKNKIWLTLSALLVVIFADQALIKAMNSLMERIREFFEQRAFGVCARLGEKLGLASASIRMTFIYVSFLTFGSPVLLYLALAFIMNFRRHMRRNRSAIWDF